VRCGEQTEGRPRTLVVTERESSSSLGRLLLPCRLRWKAQRSRAGRCALGRPERGRQEPPTGPCHPRRINVDPGDVQQARLILLLLNSLGAPDDPQSTESTARSTVIKIQTSTIAVLVAVISSCQCLTLSHLIASQRVASRSLYGRSVEPPRGLGVTCRSQHRSSLSRCMCLARCPDSCSEPRPACSHSPSLGAGRRCSPSSLRITFLAPAGLRHESSAAVAMPR
jgi:hypothetical protein